MTVNYAMNIFISCIVLYRLYDSFSPKEREYEIGSDIILLDNTTLDRNIFTLHTITIDNHNIGNFQVH